MISTRRFNARPCAESFAATGKVSATPRGTIRVFAVTDSAIFSATSIARSRDSSQGAYGNWPRRGTQWLQYDWPVPVRVGRVEVYWYIDGRGLHAPAAARLEAWDGSAWAEVEAEGQLL